MAKRTKDEVAPVGDAALTPEQLKELSARADRLERKLCPACKGTGRKGHAACEACQGTGRRHRAPVGDAALTPEQLKELRGLNDKGRAKTAAETARAMELSKRYLDAGQYNANANAKAKAKDAVGQQTEGALNVLRRTVEENPHGLSKAHLDVLRARIAKLEKKLAKERAGATDEAALRVFAVIKDRRLLKEFDTEAEAKRYAAGEPGSKVTKMTVPGRDEVLPVGDAAKAADELWTPNHKNPVPAGWLKLTREEMAMAGSAQVAVAKLDRWMPQNNKAFSLLRKINDAQRAGNGTKIRAAFAELGQVLDDADAVLPVGDASFKEDPAMTALAEKAGALWRSAPNTREGLDAAKEKVAAALKAAGTTPKELAAYVTKMATASGRRVNVNWLKGMATDEVAKVGDVDVRTDHYKFGAGKAPSGRGAWAFGPEPNSPPDKVFFAKGTVTFTEAKAQAKKWAKEMGYHTIYAQT